MVHLVHGKLYIWSCGKHITAPEHQRIVYEQKVQSDSNKNFPECAESFAEVNLNKGYNR